MENKILCNCKCGEEIKIQFHHKYYGIPEYIHGHNKGNLGKDKTKIEKILCLECENLFKNYKTDKSKYCSQKCYHKSKIGKKNVKISDALKKLYQEDKFNPMLGKKQSKKWIEEHKEIMKELYREGKMKSWNKGLKGEKLLSHYKNGYSRLGKISPMKNKKHSQESIIKIREARLNQVMPLKDTIPERLIQDKLRLANIPFKTHKSIIGQPDIFIEPNICIFIDGCYWHGCNECFDRNKLNEMQRLRIIKDNMITQKLIEQNYVVLRLWEHEIKENIEECIDKILFLLEDKNLILNKIKEGED